MCYPTTPWWPDTEHAVRSIRTIKGRVYQTLRCPHRVLVRADVGRINFVQATQVGRERHVYTVTAASRHRFKVLAGNIKNTCLRNTRQAGQLPMPD